MWVKMKDRVSSSLLAGMCTVCVTSAMAAAPGAANVAAESPAPSIPTSTARYALAASSSLLTDLVNVASLPVQNAATAWTDIAQLTYIINVFNAVNADLVSGKWTSIQPDVQAILTKEQGYLTTLEGLPASIVKTDSTAISALLSDLGASSLASSFTSLSASSTPQVLTATDTTSTLASVPGSQLFNDFLNVASLPVQNIAAAWTAVAQLTSIINVFNVVNADLVSGKWTSIQPDIEAALTKEQGYIDNLLALPDSIVKTDSAAITKLLTDLGVSSATTLTSPTGSLLKTASTESTSPLSALSISPTASSASTTFNDALNVASLPVQNANTVYKSLAQLTSIVSLPNTINADLVAGTWTKIPTDIDTAVNAELGYIKALPDVPQTIIKTDTAAITKLADDLGAGKSASTSGVSALSAKVESTTPTTQSTDDPVATVKSAVKNTLAKVQVPTTKKSGPDKTDKTDNADKTDKSSDKTDKSSDKTDKSSDKTDKSNDKNDKSDKSSDKSDKSSDKPTDKSDKSNDKSSGGKHRKAD